LLRIVYDNFFSGLKLFKYDPGPGTPLVFKISFLESPSLLPLYLCEFISTKEDTIYLSGDGDKVALVLNLYALDPILYFDLVNDEDKSL